MKQLHRGGPRAWLWAAAAALAASLVLAMALRWSGVTQPRQTVDKRSVARSRDAAPKVDAPRILAAVGPPTLLDYDGAIAQSNNAPERLLSNDAQRIGVLFDRTRTVSITKELESLQ